MLELAHLELAHGVALLLDDAVAEMAAEKLAFAERDRIAIAEREMIAHGHLADVDGPGGAQDLQHAGFLRVVALDAQEDLAVGVLAEQNIAFVEQIGLVGDEVGVPAALEAELAAEFLRAHAQILQRDLHLAMRDDFILDAGLDDGAFGQQRAVQRGLRAADGLHRDAEAKAEPQMRAASTLRCDLGVAMIGEREVDLRAAESFLRVEVGNEVVVIERHVLQHDALAGIQTGELTGLLTAAAH